LGGNGIIHFAKENSLIVDMSTIGSQAACQISETLQKKKINFLDAPVTGGDIGAQKGTLTIMVGGNKQNFEKALPALKAMGSKVVLCGEVGSGQRIKLINQLLCAIHTMALGEAFTLAQDWGIDQKIITEICGSGAAGSWALSNLGPKIIENDFAPGFKVKHIRKDLRLLKETAPHLL